jgi:hypothetical protein
MFILRFLSSTSFRCYWFLRVARGEEHFRESNGPCIYPIPYPIISSHPVPRIPSPYFPPCLPRCFTSASIHTQTDICGRDQLPFFFFFFFLLILPLSITPPRLPRIPASSRCSGKSNPTLKKGHGVTGHGELTPRGFSAERVDYLSIIIPHTITIFWVLKAGGRGSWWWIWNRSLDRFLFPFFLLLLCTDSWWMGDESF